jgi:hypothetical protein
MAFVNRAATQFEGAQTKTEGHFGFRHCWRPIIMNTATMVSGLCGIMLLGFAFGDTGGGWVSVGRERLCVTEGAVEQAADHSSMDHRLSVNAPKMRAYLNQWTTQSAELRFTYLGGTSKESALGSGAIRRQFGLKLRAQDPCNLVYAIWRVNPESKLVVSVKRNPEQHTSAECGNRGYINIKPRKASAVPRLEAGQSHTLRAEMTNTDLRLLVDKHEIWEGDVGPDAAKFDGPVGIRSDNARLEFEFLTREPEGPHPDYVKACKAGGAEE